MYQNIPAWHAWGAGGLHPRVLGFLASIYPVVLLWKPQTNPDVQGCWLEPGQYSRREWVPRLPGLEDVPILSLPPKAAA
jgi:hypothetical protein